MVLGVLSIFSAKYRSWAREALDCVTRRLTLRPCRTGFNEKVKAKVTSSIMKKSPRAARAAHKNFEAISWVFTIVMFVSLAYTVYGMYNLAVFGTCDPAHPETCVFNPSHPDYPECGDPLCDAKLHCLCDGVEIHCTEDIFIQCEGDCSCVCAGGDSLSGS